MGAFTPTPFASPIVSPNTTTLFRRTPYISPSEYMNAPTAVSVDTLVPGGNAAAQKAALAAEISRASGWVDEICFHYPDGTLAASPTTEQGWITPKNNGSIGLNCNYAPILEVDAVALGPSLANMESITQQQAELITIDDPIIWLQYGLGSYGPVTWFPFPPTVGGKVYAVWTYINGYAHNALSANALAGTKELTVQPSVPGGSSVYGAYPGTQLTIHDGANTEVVVVESVAGLKLHLLEDTLYAHNVPEPPDTVRVSALPWIVEQATISLTSALIKKRGTRSMVLPQSPATAAPPKQVTIQAGGGADEETARRLLKPLIVPYARST